MESTRSPMGENKNGGYTEKSKMTTNIKNHGNTTKVLYLLIEEGWRSKSARFGTETAKLARREETVLR